MMSNTKPGHGLPKGRNKTSMLLGSNLGDPHPLCGYLSIGYWLYTTKTIYNGLKVGLLLATLPSALVSFGFEVVLDLVLSVIFHLGFSWFGSSCFHSQQFPFFLSVGGCWYPT